MRASAGSELDPKQRKALLPRAQMLSPKLCRPAPWRLAWAIWSARASPQTHFCWAGGMKDDSVFYYRIQSPVAMIEFDQHDGRVLTPPETPQKFHIHTVVRTPNGNDYGMDLLRLHYETSPHHKAAHHHQHRDKR